MPNDLISIKTIQSPAQVSLASSLTSARRVPRNLWAGCASPPRGDVRLPNRWRSDMASRTVRGSADRHVLFKVVVVDSLNFVGSSGCCPYVVLDHEVDQSLTIDEDDALLDLLHIGDCCGRES